MLSGYRFIINRRGVATVVAQPDGLVRGVCWAISATELEGLDRKEGVKAGTYVRVQLTVECDSGPAVAWVYMASDSSVGTPRIGYLERVLAGAKEHDLPECYRDELTSWAPLSML